MKETAELLTTGWMKTFACMQKSMKLRCRIKFIESKVVLGKLKEISVKILAKEHSRCYKIFLICMKVNYFKVFFEDFLTKHLKSSKYRQNLTDGNVNLVRKIEEFVNRSSKSPGRKKAS